MRKKLLATLLAITLFLAMAYPNSMVSRASELPEDSDMTEGPVEISDITLENIDMEDISTKNIDKADRPYSGEYTTFDGISAYSNDNTNPNSALLFEDNTGDSGTFTTANEERWYAFVLSEKTKVSIPVGMGAAMDVDLYVFSLDSASGTLSVIGQCTNSALGEAEYYSAVLAAGTYFAAITNYAGVGSYAVAYYQTTVDVNYEVNDSIETATDIIFDQKMIGAIDSPYDIDLYKFTVTEYTWVRMIGNYPGKYELGILGSTAGAVGEREGNTGNVYVFSPGTYWFIVRSMDGGYSSTVTYQCTFEKVGSAASKEDYMKTAVTPKTGLVIRQSFDGKLTYVNGNMVDIRYLWTDESHSDTAGGRLAFISINPDASVRCTDMKVVHYSSSTHPIMNNFGRGPALMMEFVGNSVFYKIQWEGYGDFAGESARKDSSVVTVLIDPASGKLLDIYDPNYYYTIKLKGGINMRVDYDDTIAFN